MCFLQICSYLTRNAKLVDVKLGTVRFRNNPPEFDIKEDGILDRKQTAVNSTVCPYVVGWVLLIVKNVG